MNMSDYLYNTYGASRSTITAFAAFMCAVLTLCLLSLYPLMMPMLMEVASFEAAHATYGMYAFIVMVMIWQAGENWIRYELDDDWYAYCEHFMSSGHEYNLYRSK